MNKKNESRRERFQRLASKRTSAVLEKLRVLGNCSNKSLYDYSDDEVRKIFCAVESELKATRLKFQITRSRKKSFQL